MIVRFLAGVLLVASATCLAQAPAPSDQGPVLHPLHVPQPDTGSSEALLLVEIPAGGSIKYELDDSGHLFVDRFLDMPVAYPANYGSMPRTLAGDGDPLDALVITRQPLHPGVLIHFRPIGVLRMVDSGENDEKIIGVPTSEIDTGYGHIRDLKDLPRSERSRIEAFFDTYKANTPSGNPVRLSGFGDASEARRAIEAALHRADTAPTR